MKLAFVVPRYGVGIRGGAEQAARGLAEHLVVDGWDVEVLTTCAVDNRTWTEELPAGTETVNGVTVHRFGSESGRDRSFDKVSGRVLAYPARASHGEQLEWLRLQGPNSAALLDAVRTSDADAVAFYPYLYAPTVLGIPLAGRRAVLHPAAHDEAPIRLSMYREVFEGAAGLVYHTASERQLVERRFKVASTPQVVLGLGVDDPPAGATTPVEGPYLLYVGRVDEGKGTRVLAAYVDAYRRHRRSDIQLVLAGPVQDRPSGDGVVVLGEVDDATKWALYEGATTFVMPSAYESFSLVLMEAWSAGRAAIVNGASAVLREHCERSGGGVWFDGYARFEVLLDRLLGDASLRASMGAAGRRYVEAHYRWPVLIARYARFLEGVAGRG